MKILEVTLGCLGVLAIIAGFMATPLAIMYGVYTWAVVDVAFKVALWTTVKAWVVLLSGLFIGWGLFELTSVVEKKRLAAGRVARRHKLRAGRGKW